MDFLDLIVFLLGGLLCGTVLIIAYFTAAISILHKIDKNIDENIELKKTE